MGLRILCHGIAMSTALGLVAGCQAVSAQSVSATPETINEVMKQVRSGQTVVLQPGDYGVFKFYRRSFDPAIEIDASKARFTGVYFSRVKGVVLTGGVVDGPREKNGALGVDFSQNVTVQKMHIRGSRIGASAVRSQDIAFLDNDFTGIRSDGINIAGVQRFHLARNICKDFNPMPSEYDDNGQKVREGDHPDCIQGWSMKGFPPTSDGLIEDNVAEGAMQGIFFTDPLKAGGIERFVVRRNRIHLSFANGIILENSRDSIVRDNAVSVIPGSRFGVKPYYPVQTTWIIVKGERNIVCGNAVSPRKFSTDTGKCKTSDTK